MRITLLGDEKPDIDQRRERGDSIQKGHERQQILRNVQAKNLWDFSLNAKSWDWVE